MAQMPDLNVVCKNCGNEVSPYITECPYCGNRLRKRAPKIERDGTVSEPRKAAQGAQAELRRGCRAFAPGEIPGIRGEHHARPYATIALVVLSLFGYLLLFPIALVDVGGRRADRRRSGGAWRPRPSSTRASGTSWPRSPRSRSSAGCSSAATGRSWSLVLFVLCGMGGIALAVAVDPTPLAVGGNGAALGPAVRVGGPGPHARAAAARTTTATCSAPRSSPRCCCSCRWRSPDASAIAGFAGGAAGLLVGLVLARARIA